MSALVRDLGAMIDAARKLAPDSAATAIGERHHAESKPRDARGKQKRST